MNLLETNMKSILLDILLYTHNNIIAWIPFHIIRMIFLRCFMKIEIGQKSSIHLGFRLYTRGQILIGKNCVIDRNCSLDARAPIVLGDNVNLAPEVMILTAYHNPDDEEFNGIEKSVFIDDYAWIATRALILPGVKIGRGAVVAAGSVVTKDVPPKAIFGGNPAKFIRERKGDQRYQLAYKRFLH